MSSFHFIGALLFVACSFVFGYIDNEVDFKKYSVLTVIPADDDQVKFLQHLHDAESENLKLDFWNHPRQEGEMVNIGVPHEKIEELRQILDENSIIYFVKSDNLEESIEIEKIENPNQYSSGSRSSSFAIDQYHRYEEIVSYAKNLATEYPNLVQTQTLGYTLENREILTIRIGLNSNAQKPVILLDAGIHAREWIAPATALYVVNELVTKHSTDTSIHALLTKYDWYVIPVVNPDGYAYTWNSNRLWRKNRSRSSNGCYGADPNRNFPLGFGGASTSTNPCSDIYPGRAAFSENESQAVKKLTEAHASKVKAVLTLHSYGQMWMSPFGYVSQRPTDYNTMYNAAKDATNALRAVHGTTFKYGSIYEVIYPTGGGSTDWQYSVTNTPYIYAVELRDKGLYGFQLPRSYIIPTGQETWAGIKNLAQGI